MKENMNFISEKSVSFANYLIKLNIIINRTSDIPTKNILFITSNLHIIFWKTTHTY